MNPYLDALLKIPSGQTRSFMELAAMAGRPGAARAAGRALASCRTSSKLAVHRVVSSDGRARDTAVHTVQLRRLRREGARPRARETIADWAKRTKTRFIGYYPARHFAPRGDDRTIGWNPEQVEAFASEATALARGFVLLGSKTHHEDPLPSRRSVPPESNLDALPERFGRIDWRSMRKKLGRDGVCRIEALLTPSECARILNDSTDRSRFERSIDMLPHGYGVGTYHYYREPLPTPAATLRELLYSELAPAGYPEKLLEFWRRCRAAGQNRSSSILIGYGRGGINHPHRDVYGPVFFPFQALITLSKRGRDFTGGEFYLADDDGAGPTRKIAVSEGDVVIFATRDRHAKGRQVPVRHGMTTVTRGKRYGLGVVFHLAE